MTKRIAIVWLLVCCSTFAQIRQWAYYSTPNIFAMPVMGVSYPPGQRDWQSADLAPDCLLWLAMGFSHSTAPGSAILYRISDASGHGNDFTNAGVWSVSAGGCYDFDGTNHFSRAVDPTPFIALAEFTVCIWAKADLTDNLDTFWSISNADNSPSGNAQFTASLRSNLAWVTGTVFHVLGVRGGVVAFEAAANKRLTIGVWHHLAITMSATGSKFYVDGVDLGATYDDGTSASYEPFSIYAGLDSLNIAARFQPLGSTERFFDGRLDDFRIYSRALTASEVAGIYSQGNR